MDIEVFIPQINAYRRGKQVILIPKSQARDRKYKSEYFSVNQTVEFDDTEEVSSIGKKIFQAFSLCQLKDTTPPEEEEFPFKSLYPKFGVEDWNEFVKCVDSTICNLINNQFELTPIAGSRVCEDKKITTSDLSEDALGNALIEVLDLSRELNPFAVKHTNPNSGSFAGKLSPAITEQMERLEAEVKEAYPPGKNMVVEQFLVPEAMKEFFSYSFPAKYRTHESDYKTYMIWGLEMHGRPSYIDHETVIADRGDRFLVSFAYADGGNYYLAFDLKDADPSDPAVFKIDHYDPEQRIYSGIPLSEFLADLIPENR